MISDERKKPISAEEQQDLSGSDNNTSTNIQQPISNNTESAADKSSEDQEGWVAVGSGLGIDE
jgi:hypothetical protein